MECATKAKGFNGQKVKKLKKQQPHIYRDQESKSLGVVQIEVIADVKFDDFSQFFRGKSCWSCWTENPMFLLLSQHLKCYIYAFSVSSRAQFTLNWLLNYTCIVSQMTI